MASEWIDPIEEAWAKVPATDATTDTIKQWAWNRRNELQSLAKSGKVQNTDSLLTKLTNLESRPNAQNRTTLEEWILYSDSELWGTYVKEQTALNEQKKIEAENLEYGKKLVDARNRASDAAIQARIGYQNPSNTTVIAGLTDLDSDAAWVGKSGVENHTVRSKAADSSDPDYANAKKVMSVMDTLLSGVQRVENWPVNACGEVDAMEQYLLDKQIFASKDIPQNFLCSHAETWNSTTSRWQGRGACRNCNQWLDKINAFRS